MQCFWRIVIGELRIGNCVFGSRYWVIRKSCRHKSGRVINLIPNTKDPIPNDRFPIHYSTVFVGQGVIVGRGVQGWVVAVGEEVGSCVAVSSTVMLAI